jgi:hypothetical protein
MIGEYRELSIKALTGMANEMELTAEDKAGAARVRERLSRQFPGVFKSLKLN